MNKKTFKTSILFVLILCMCVVFVGCGRKKGGISGAVLPEGVSQEVYDDVILSLNKMQTVYQTDEQKTKRKNGDIYPLYDNGLHDLSEKYKNDNGEYISSLSEEEVEILVTMGMIDSYVQDHFDKGILNNNKTGEKNFIFDDSIKEYFQQLSKLLIIDLCIDVQENKIIIKQIESENNK